jgi:hypothetical protein
MSFRNIQIVGQKQQCKKSELQELLFSKGETNNSNRWN